MKVVVRWADQEEYDAIPDEHVIPYSNAATVWCDDMMAIYWVGLMCRDRDSPAESAWLMDCDTRKFEMTAEILDCIAKLAQVTWGLPFRVRFIRSNTELSMNLRKHGFVLSQAPHDLDYWEFTKPIQPSC